MSAAGCECRNCKLERAERTLKSAGWTYLEGASEWKPPLGPSASPLLDEIDRLRSQVERAATLATVWQMRSHLSENINRSDDAYTECATELREALSSDERA